MKWQTTTTATQWSKVIVFQWTMSLILGVSVWSQEEVPDWQSDIEPVLNDHCVKCHGPLKQKAHLDLSTFHGLIKGSENGPVIKAGVPASSPLYTALLKGSDPHMPPKKQLESNSIDLIKNWILHYRELPPVHAEDQDEQEPPLALDTTSSLHPPEALSAPQAIDFFIETKLLKSNISPTPLCDDLTFQRRLYLDLVGRPPTLLESDQFLRSGSIGKRSEEVDKLLRSEAFAMHFTELFDVFLMERRGEHWENQRKQHGWHDYLKTAFAKNHPWDQVIRNIILARTEETTSSPGSLWFLYERENNHQAMAEAIAPIVFGTQIKCAQCHDHPLAHEIKQGHYWAMVTAFNRSKNVKTSKGIGIAESAIGGFISFANLKKESQPATLSFLNGVAVQEKRPEPDVKEMDLPEYYLIAPPEKEQQPDKASVPKFSRRQALAKAVTQNNPLLARSMVNRIWALLLGRGLVHPVDEMNSKHPPSHPSLLNWLSEDFEQNGYNVHRLIRIIVLSETYQRSTWTEPNRPHALDTFAWALEKPLSAETVYRSILVVCGLDPENPPKDLKTDALRQAFIQHFPDLLPVEYNATLQQTMFLSNSPLLQALLEPTANNTTQKLLDIENIEKRIQQAFLSVYGRLPDAEEAAATKQFLTHRLDRPKEGVQQLLWTLITSAEFLTNH